MKALTERHRLRIIEDIVNIKCPHCDIAIFDFNGCYAIRHKEDHVGEEQSARTEAMCLVQKYLHENVVDGTERGNQKSLKRDLKDLGINV